MDTKVNDFLTKQLFIDKNVVTFRSLSRQFNLHVNAAKNELATFHNVSKSSPTPAYATYLLSGEVAPALRTVPPSHITQDERMDVDMDEAENGDETEDDGDVVPCTKVTLVGEGDLENAKTQYTRIFSEHVYSLSPATLTDAGLVCEPAEKVHAADATIPIESAVLLGRIVAPNVLLGKSMPVASSSKAPAPLARRKTMPAEMPEAEAKSKSNVEKAATLKPRASGTLDFSKARQQPKDESKEKVKPKEEKSKVNEEKKKNGENEKKLKEKDSEKEEKVRVKSNEKSLKESKAKVSAKHSESDCEEEVVEKKKAAPVPKAKKETFKPGRTASIKTEAKRGVKRRSIFGDPSDTEDGDEGSRSPATPPTTSKTKVRKRVVLSDEEDDDEEGGPRAPKNGSSYRAQAKSAVNKSLRAMMDIDDDEVIKVSRSELSSSPEAPATTEADDSEMVEDSEPERIKPVPRKKKEKKVVPVGSNGLKKRRIMKSRSTTDEKGYFVTEDYSSYESVNSDEAESEPVKPKTKKVAAPRPKKVPEKEKPKPKPKLKTIIAESSRTSSKGTDGKGRKIVGSTKGKSQGSITNFFQ